MSRVDEDGHTFVISFVPVGEEYLVTLASPKATLSQRILDAEETAKYQERLIARGWK